MWCIWIRWFEHIWMSETNSLFTYTKQLRFEVSKKKCYRIEAITKIPIHFFPWYSNEWSCFTAVTHTRNSSITLVFYEKKCNENETSYSNYGYIIFHSFPHKSWMWHKMHDFPALSWFTALDRYHQIVTHHETLRNIASIGYKLEWVFFLGI